MDVVRASPGITVGDLSAHFDVSRITVLKHLETLDKAGLIVSQKDGARRRLYLNTVPLQEIHERWTSTFTERGAQRVLGIKHSAEAWTRAKKDDE